MSSGFPVMMTDTTASGGRVSRTPSGPTVTVTGRLVAGQAERTRMVRPTDGIIARASAAQKA